MTSLIRHSSPGAQRRPPRPTHLRNLATWILGSDRSAGGLFRRTQGGESPRCLRENDPRSPRQPTDSPLPERPAVAIDGELGRTECVSKANPGPPQRRNSHPHRARSKLRLTYPVNIVI